MDLPVLAWLDAATIRRSRRSYARDPLDGEQLARIERVCREFRPFPEARVELVHEPIEKVATGVVGGYGRVSGAPCYLAFIGRMGSAHVQECVGYTGEGVILEATSLGLGTCWVGGFFKPGAVARSLRLATDETVIGVSPVGTVRPLPSLTDLTFKAISGSSGRKGLDELVEGDVVPGTGLKAALEAARRAPSARNRQPWRFRITNGIVTVFVSNEKPRSKLSPRLDCGIAMLHFELGARAAGLAGRWELLEAPDVARYVPAATSSF
jgi:hypothetical protein